MECREAIDYFEGIRQLGEAFEPTVSRQGIEKWLENGVPPWRQLQLEAMTQGALKADPDCLPDYIIKKETVAGVVRFVRVKK